MIKYNKGEISSLHDYNLPPWERSVRQGGWMNKKVMKENLLDFKRVMDKYKIPFILIFGTCLGVIREKDFISWDTDVDVACYAENHIRAKGIIDDMRKLNFYIPDVNESYMHSHFFIRGGEKIEIWWFLRIKEERVVHTTVRWAREYLEQTKEIDFIGHRFKVPKKAEEYLKMLYGDSWRVPNPKGSYIPQKD